MINEVIRKYCVVVQMINENKTKQKHTYETRVRETYLKIIYT